MFSIMGALCKADNVVTRDEIDAVEQIFGMLKLQGESREQAKAAFNRGKQADFDLDAAVDQFAQLSRGRGPMLQLFLQLQCMAVVADGRIDPAEHAMLVRIAQRHRRRPKSSAPTASLRVRDPTSGNIISDSSGKHQPRQQSGGLLLDRGTEPLFNL